MGNFFAIQRQSSEPEAIATSPKTQLAQPDYDLPTASKRKRHNSEDEEASSPAAAPTAATSAPPLLEHVPPTQFTIAVTPTPPPKKKSKSEQMLDKTRAPILDNLSSQFKTMFGQIGFCKFGKSRRVPALIVDLAEAPEGPVWNQWIKVYEKRLKEKKLHLLPYIVYHYCNNGELCFGIMYLSSFTPYEVEAGKVEKGIAKLPQRFQRKIDHDEDLTFHDESMVLAYEWMEEDLKKEPWERKRWEA